MVDGRPIQEPATKTNAVGAFAVLNVVIVPSVPVNGLVASDKSFVIHPRFFEGIQTRDRVISCSMQHLTVGKSVQHA